MDIICQNLGQWMWAESHFITINPESVKEMGKALYLAGNCHLKLRQKQRTLNKGTLSPPRPPPQQSETIYTLEILETGESANCTQGSIQ